MRRRSGNMVKLGSVCEIIGGGTPSKSKSEYYNGKIPWASVRDMRSEILKNTELTITEEAVIHSSSKIITKGNVIIATRVGLGKVCLLNQDTAINQDLKGVIPKKNNLNPDYLFWWFKSISEEIINAGTGLTVQGVKLPFIKELNFPLIPLSEQKQIVEILDQAFTAIDQAKANIEKNIQNAKELFQSKLNDIFSQKGDGWEEKKFKEVCILQRGFDLPKRLRKKGEYSLVTSSGIKESIFDYKVEGPGVVTGRSGSIGNVFYVNNNFWPLNTALYIKDFKGNNELYIYYFLKNFDLSKYSSGAGVPTLNRNFVHDKFVLSTNNIEDQIAIVNTLESLNNKSKEVENNYLLKLSTLEELKKSILQKAFAGELTNKMAEV